MNIEWIETTEERYDEMLGVLPPALMERRGFLVGEPMDHRTCSIKNRIAPTFSAFVQVGDKFYEANQALTVAEYRAAELPKA